MSGCSVCGTKLDPRTKHGRCLSCLRVFPPEHRAYAKELRLRGHGHRIIKAHIFDGAPLTPIKRDQTHQCKTINGAPIITRVSDAMQIDRQSILSEARWAHLVDARSVVVMAMRARGASFEHIGRALGRDHTSVLHLHRTFGARCLRRPWLAAIAERVAA